MLDVLFNCLSKPVLCSFTSFAEKLYRGKHEEEDCIKTIPIDHKQTRLINKVAIAFALQ
jgi:hypothetical protein